MFRLNSHSMAIAIATNRVFIVKHYTTCYGYLAETCSVVCFTIKTRLVANKGSGIIFRHKPAQQDTPTQDQVHLNLNL
jgi:hypothetical protein